MDVSEVSSKYFPLVKKNWLPLALGIFGMILFIYGLIGLSEGNKTDSDEITFETNSSVKQSLGETASILVDVEGAVVKPGVYRLPQQSRIQDGLIAAGGLSAQADREHIAKNMNLATKLSDGAKVYIPTVGETNLESVLNASTSVSSSVLNVNSASQSELEALPGIGPVTAQKIISGRPYASIDDLLSKKIVSSKVFNQIKDKISVY